MYFTVGDHHPSPTDQRRFGPHVVEVGGRDDGRSQVSLGKLPEKLHVVPTNRTGLNKRIRNENGQVSLEEKENFYTTNGFQ